MRSSIIKFKLCPGLNRSPRLAQYQNRRIINIYFRLICGYFFVCFLFVVFIQLCYTFFSLVLYFLLFLPDESEKNRFAFSLNISHYYFRLHFYFFKLKTLFRAWVYLFFFSLYYSMETITINYYFNKINKLFIKQQ